MPQSDGPLERERGVVSRERPVGLGRASLGVDFDNTIVGYDALFQRVACEWRCIPDDLPANKSEVRNYLRRVGQEEVWTRMQGVVYGARMAEAVPYPGVREFFRTCRQRGLRVFIISHKTRQPFLGDPHDLHAAALEWLEQQGFFAADGIGLSRDQVFFELTKEAKLARIAACGCTHFVDDLPEFLGEAAFPAAVQRVLFDPNGMYVGESRFARATSWAEVGRLLWAEADERVAGAHASVSGKRRLTEPDVRDNAAGVASSRDNLEELRAQAAPFLARHGLGPDFTLTPLPGGANNRVLLVESKGLRHVLKSYFHDPADARDRFRAEQGLYRLAWTRGLRGLPEPLGWEATFRFGLFAYVEGRRLRPDEITEGRVAEALDFVRGLNAVRGSPAAVDLPLASEAVFSLIGHLDLIERRVTRLRGLASTSPVDQAAAAFVADALAPAWDQVRRRIESEAGRDLEAALPRESRCVSPSDFGFHNALLATDDRLRFFDFEYAGWDDPAKLICDFFCQPQVPVGLEHWERFVGSLGEALDSEGRLATRAARLLPAYRIKWSCILLNEFLPTEQARRRFAGGEGDLAARKTAQLAKARKMLEQMVPRAEPR